jgi:hypothetical protein
MLVAARLHCLRQRCPHTAASVHCYQPETMYALMLLYFIAAGAGPFSVDQL